jgi:antitoxin (DNA-binding transcriptional repressor) of toxin-antitoxin stability system
MKTLTVREAKSRLGKLVNEVQRGAPIILIYKNKLAKLERYELLDPDADSRELEGMLLEAVRDSHSSYSRKDLEAAAARVRKRAKKR